MKHFIKNGNNNFYNGGALAKLFENEIVFINYLFFNDLIFKNKH